MSLDYPNREDWLKIRKLAARPLKYLHMSGFGLATRRKSPFFDQIPEGVTYNVGRNKAKRAKRISLYG